MKNLCVPQKYSRHRYSIGKKERKKQALCLDIAGNKNDLSVWFVAVSGMVHGSVN